MLELERSYAVLAQILQQPTSIAERPVEVVLFARASDFKELHPKRTNVIGTFSGALSLDVEPTPVIVLHSSEVIDEIRLTWQHELAHRFLHERFGSLPRWVDEGLAEFYSSARIEGDRAHLGGPSSGDFSERPYFWSARLPEGYEQGQVPLRLAPSLHDLVAADRYAFYEAKDSEAQVALYVASWRLAHLLMVGRAGGYRHTFEEFLGDLQRGTSDAAAFDARFGTRAAELEADYRVYLSNPRLARVVVPFKPPAVPPIAVHELPHWQVHLLWARVADEPARVERELEAARSPSPDVMAALALYRMRHGEIDQAKAGIDELLASHPNDPRLLCLSVIWYRWRARSRSASPRDVEDAAPVGLIDRLAKTAITADELVTAARYYLNHGRIDDGLMLSRRAVENDPLCAECQAVQAVLLKRNGKLDEAASAIARAIMLSPHGGAVEELLEQRRQIEAMRAER